MQRETGRRDFMKTAGLTAGMAAATALSPRSDAQPKEEKMSDKMIWANLLHLGYNMWGDREPAEGESRSPYWPYKPYLRFDDTLWNDLLKKMAEAGMNMVVIDLGEGVQYESHPELAVKGSWSRDRLEEELAKARELGLEPIPKLNFSACHDQWLGPYARCLSTETYYAVCRDVIAEVIELFDTPRFFHLGMDEETAQHQRFFAYAVIRQYDLWWHDFSLLVEAVEKGGSRAWIWSDYVWHHPEAFFEKMPKSVLQSNWYYGEKFGEDVNYVKAYHDLEEHGYDQIPTGSNWSNNVNFEKTVAYCADVIKPPRLLGFLTAPWKPTLEECRDHHLRAVEQVGRAIQSFQAAQ